MSHDRKIDSKIIHSNPWFEYRHDRIVRDDQNEGDYFYLDTGGAAMIIPILERDNILLVRQYRYLKDKKSTEFPCGGSREGESPSETVKRELMEETGYEVGELIKIGEFEPVNSYCLDSTSLYVGLDLKKKAEPISEEGFFLEAITRRVDEFEEMIKNGEIWDGQTLASWAIARDYVNQLSY